MAAAPGLRTLRLRCYLRYQHCNINHNDECMLAAISNGPMGTTIGVFQEDPGPNPQSFLRLIGTIYAPDAERLNHLARPQLMGAFRPRGGPRLGSRFMPDVVSVTVSPFSPVYPNTYPPGYGVLPAPGAGNTRRPYIMLEVVVRT